MYHSVSPMCPSYQEMIDRDVTCESHGTFDPNSPSQLRDPPSQSSCKSGFGFQRYRHVAPPLPGPKSITHQAAGRLRSGRCGPVPFSTQTPLFLFGGCLDFFHSPLCGGLARFDTARFGSAVLQVQQGNPLVPAAALLAEAADVLQGLRLQRLHRRVLQSTAENTVRR